MPDAELDALLEPWLGQQRRRRGGRDPGAGADRRAAGRPGHAAAARGAARVAGRRRCRRRGSTRRRAGSSRCSTRSRSLQWLAVGLIVLLAATSAAAVLAGGAQRARLEPRDDRDHPPARRDRRADRAHLPALDRHRRGARRARRAGARARRRSLLLGRQFAAARLGHGRRRRARPGRLGAACGDPADRRSAGDADRPDHRARRAEAHAVIRRDPVAARSSCGRSASCGSRSRCRSRRAREKTDAIVVPTGSGGRIPRGLALLRDGAARRDARHRRRRDVRPREFAAEYDVPGATDGLLRHARLRRARHARQRPRDGASGSAERKVRSLRLVTSDWHMRRAALELENALPEGTTVLRDAVRTEPSLWIAVPRVPQAARDLAGPGAARLTPMTVLRSLAVLRRVLRGSVFFVLGAVGGDGGRAAARARASPTPGRASTAGACARCWASGCARPAAARPAPALYALKHESFFEAIDLPRRARLPGAVRQGGALPHSRLGPRRAKRLRLGHGRARPGRQGAAGDAGRGARRSSEPGGRWRSFPKARACRTARARRCSRALPGCTSCSGCRSCRSRSNSGPLYHRWWKRPRHDHAALRRADRARPAARGDRGAGPCGDQLC